MISEADRQRFERSGVVRPRGALDARWLDAAFDAWSWSVSNPGRLASGLPPGSDQAFQDLCNPDSRPVYEGLVRDSPVRRSVTSAFRRFTDRIGLQAEEHAMPARDHRLTTRELARFVADGYLRFDALVPESINTPIVAELVELEAVKRRQAFAAMGLGAADDPAATAAYRHPQSLTPLSDCYPPPSRVGELLRLPRVAGIIESLVGADPLLDHDFVHLLPAGSRYRQHLHVDAVIDSCDPSFDIQLFYYPSAVAPGEGGTRFVPGTHLRRTRAEGVARYQHLLGEQQYSGPAGTLMVFHQGLWHAGQANPGTRDRWLYKIRLNPRVPQVRLWNLEDFEAVHNDARDHTFAHPRADSVAQILRTMQPWQQGHESRYEQMERARLWRYLSGDPHFDVDYYHTRIEGRTRANGGVSP